MEEPNYPLAVALEKAGYQILSFEARAETVFNPDVNKSELRRVAHLRVISNKDAKMLFIAEKETNDETAVTVEKVNEAIRRALSDYFKKA
jgi:hypothetical protein